MSDHADTIRTAISRLMIPDYEAHAALDALAARCDTLENALRDLLDDMGIDDIDPRLRYVVAQITREVLADARAALAATDTTRDAGRPPKPSKPAWPTYAESGELVPPPGERQET